MAGMVSKASHGVAADNLQDGLWGPWKPKRGYTQVFWVCPGVWIPNWGYTQVFEYAQAFGSPTGATYRRLDPQLWLHTGVWIPNRGYTQVFGSPTAATHRCKLQV